MNLFTHAILHQELLDFALGKGAYFLVDRDSGRHSVIQSWINHILPLVSDVGIDYVNERIEDMFKELLECSLDIKLKNEVLLNHLHVYYYLNAEGRIAANDLIGINDRVMTSLNQYVDVMRDQDDSKAEIINESIKRIRMRGGLRTT